MSLGEPDSCTCGRTTTGGSLCPVHGDQWFGPPKSNNDNKPFPALSYLIPKGDYCYTSTGRVVIDDKVMDGDDLVSVPYYFKPEIKACPFWKPVGDGDAFCAYMGETSYQSECNNLVWDQVKECGVNPEDDYSLDALERMSEDTPMIKSFKRQKKFPQFMESLVTILMDSETNELTYDGITYTLSKHIYEGHS